MEELLHLYGEEIALGSSSSIAVVLIALVKRLTSKLAKMDERLMQLEKDLAVNIALDNDRNEKRLAN